MKFQIAVGLWILMTAAAMAQTLQTGMWVGGGPLAGAPAVQNAPFSAELVTIIERTAESGSGFHRETQGTVARNSHGMTYFEMQLASPTPEINKGTRITITDPALHTITTLDPQQKTAFISGNYNGSNAAGILPPGGAVAVSPMGAAVAMPTAANPAVTKLNPTEPAPASHAAFSAASPTAAGHTNAKTEELGSKYIEGLTVTGVRTTRVNSWVVGGNSKTFTSTTEAWTSPELGIIVQSENTDSMGTRSVTKLVNLTRTEPDAALFQVPSGYTIKDNPPRATSSGR
jgi:hypothetical protein